MKRIRVLILFLLITLLFISHTYAVDISIKFSAGRGFFNLQSINRLLNDWAMGEKRDIEANPNWTYMGGNVSELHSGLEFAAEILVAVTSRITVGIGAGYIYSDLIEDKAALTIKTLVETWLEVKPIKISALPFIISGYYFFPLSSTSKLYVMGGAGPVWGKYIEREGWRLTTEDNFNYQSFQRTSGRGSIVLAGFGFEYEFEPGLRLIFEGLGRMCQISDFQGENNQEETGTLYYFEEYIQDFEIWQAKNQIKATAPSAENYRSVQKAIVDLSGLMIRIGLVIKF